MIIDKVLFWRYFLDFLIVIPAAGIAFTPFMRDYKGKRIFDIIFLYLVLGAAVFAGAFGWTRYEGLPIEYFYYAFAVIFLILYFIVIKRSFFKKLFFAVNALFLASFSCLYARFIAGSITRIKGIPEILTQPSCVVLCLELLLMLIFLLLTRNGFSHMVSNPRLNYIWKWLALLPMFFTLMITWAYPQDLESMFQGQSLPLALVSLGLIPLGIIGVYRIIITLMT